MYTKRGFKKAEHPVFIIQICQKSVLVDTYVRREVVGPVLLTMLNSLKKVNKLLITVLYKR